MLRAERLDSLRANSSSSRSTLDDTTQQCHVYHLVACRPSGQLFKALSALAHAPLSSPPPSRALSTSRLHGRSERPPRCLPWLEDLSSARTL